MTQKLEQTNGYGNIMHTLNGYRPSLVYFGSRGSQEVGSQYWRSQYKEA